MDPGRLDRAPRRFYGLQVLRGVAAVLVVLHHESELAGEHIAGSPHLRWMSNGAFGVDIFFPISGFVMLLAGQSLVRRRGTWQEFAWRRLVRVAPLYWIFTTLKLVVALLLPAVLSAFQISATNVLGSYLFIPTHGEYGAPIPVLPVGWTLNFEAFFYVIVAAVIAWRLPLLRWISAILLAVVTIGIALPPSWGAWTLLSHLLLLEFLAGMLLARFATEARQLPATVAVSLLVFGSAMALFGPGETVPAFGSLRVLYWGVPGALVVLAVLALEDRLPWRRWKAALLVGDSSYSLYLTHTFVLPAAALLASRLRLHGSGGLAVFAIASLLLSILAALAVHRWLEQPMLRWMEGWRVSWVTRSADG